MSTKKHESDTIKQQRKANKEFIELKKIERGEIERRDEPQNEVYMPPAEKLKNFWYYHGKIFVISVLVIIGIIFSTVQCMNKPEYDLKIVYFTYEQVPESVTQKLEKNLEKYCTDTNNDSKINISVINCSVEKDAGQIEKYQKLQAIIYADEQAVLFITDDESVKYFNNIRTDNTRFFKEKTATLPDNLFGNSGYKPKNKLTLSVRNLKGTDLNKKGANYIKTAENLIEKIKSQ